MRRVAGEMDALDFGVRRQPSRQPAGVGALPLHAQREGLDAAHGQVAFKRAEHRADGAGETAQGREVLFVANHRAAQNVAVPRKVLGERVHAEVRTQLQRPQQQRGGEGRVHYQRGAGGAGDGGDAVHLGHPQQRVRNGFDQNAAGFRLSHGGFQRGQVANVGEAHLDAGGFEHIQQ